MRKITRGGRRRLALGGALVVMLATGSTAAWAAKPDRAPFTPGPTSLEPGQACAFPVEIAQAPGSNYSQTTFGNGRFVVTGSGRDRVTNLNTSESAVLRTSGKLTVTELANGDQRIHASGRTVFFFFEGDQGPFGEVGADGALYYIVGHVDETLDPDTGFTVTSFDWSGTATELCSLID